MKIKHSSSKIDKEDYTIVENVLKNNFVGEGNLTNELETRLAKFTHKDFCKVLNSGSSALLVALLVLKKKDQEKNNVITSSYICPAVINCILQANLNPIIADINETNVNININDVLNKINNKTLAVIIPHLAGIPIDFSELNNTKIPIIENCAQAIGSKFNEEPVGFLGDFCIYSFGSTKMITGGIGGAILTNYEEYYGEIKDITEYEKDPEYYKNKDWTVSYNMKISDINSALILSQFLRLDDFIRKRRKIAESYDSFFIDKSLFLIQEELLYEFFNRYRYYLVYEKSKEMVNFLNSKSIDARNSIAHNIAEYFNISNCKNLKKISKMFVSIPIHPQISDKEVEFIVKQLDLYWSRL